MALAGAEMEVWRKPRPPMGHFLPTCPSARPDAPAGARRGCATVTHVTRLSPLHDSQGPILEGGVRVGGVGWVSGAWVAGIYGKFVYQSQ